MAVAVGLARSSVGIQLPNGGLAHRHKAMPRPAAAHLPRRYTAADGDGDDDQQPRKRMRYSTDLNPELIREYAKIEAMFDLAADIYSKAKMRLAEVDNERLRQRDTELASTTSGCWHWRLPVLRGVPSGLAAQDDP